MLAPLRQSGAVFDRLCDWAVLVGIDSWTGLQSIDNDSHVSSMNNESTGFQGYNLYSYLPFDNSHNEKQQGQSRIVNVDMKEFGSVSIQRFRTSSEDDDVYSNSSDNNTMNETISSSNLATFCFPDGVKLCRRNSVGTSDINELASVNTFIMTDEFGQRSYLTCLSLLRPLALETLSNGVDPPTLRDLYMLFPDVSLLNDDILAMTCLCVVSRLPYRSVIRDALACALPTLQRCDSETFILECCRIVDILMHVPTPAAGLVSIQFDVFGEEVICPPPPRSGLPLMDVPLRPLFLSLGGFSTLGFNSITALFTSLLTERNIIFVSSNYALLSIASEGALSLIHPFSWCHTFISVLPSHLLEYVEAPGTFVMGVHSRHKTFIMEMSDAVVFDLDLSTVHIPDHNPLPILPVTAATLLRNRLDAVQLHPEVQFADAVAIGGAEFSTLRSTHQRHFQTRVRLAFFEIVALLFRDYRKHLMFDQRVFNSDSFIDEQSSQAHPFFKQVCATQLFLVFVKERRSYDRDSFDILAENLNSNVPSSVLSSDTQMAARQDMAYVNRKDNISWMLYRNAATATNISDNCDKVNSFLPTYVIALLEKDIPKENTGFLVVLPLRKPNEDFAHRSIRVLSCYIEMAQQSVDGIDNSTLPYVPTSSTASNILAPLLILRAMFYAMSDRHIDALADYDLVWKVDIKLFPLSIVQNIFEALTPEEHRAITCDASLTRLHTSIASKLKAAHSSILSHHNTTGARPAASASSGIGTGYGGYGDLTRESTMPTVATDAKDILASMQTDGVFLQDAFVKCLVLLRITLNAAMGKQLFVCLKERYSHSRDNWLIINAKDTDEHDEHVHRYMASTVEGVAMNDFEHFLETWRRVVSFRGQAALEHVELEASEEVLKLTITARTREGIGYLVLTTLRVLFIPENYVHARSALTLFYHEHVESIEKLKAKRRSIKSLPGLKVTYRCFDSIRTSISNNNVHVVSKCSSKIELSSCSTTSRSLISNFFSSTRNKNFNASGTEGSDISSVSPLESEPTASYNSCSIWLPRLDQEAWLSYLREIAAGHKIATGSKNPAANSRAARNILLAETLTKMGFPAAEILTVHVEAQSYKSLLGSTLDSLLNRIDPQPNVLDKFTTETLVYHANKIWAGLGSGCVVVIDEASMRPETELWHHRSRVTALVYCSRRIWSASLDCTVHVFDVSTRQPLTVLDRHTDGVIAISVVCAGSFVWTIGVNGEVFIWDARNYEFVNSIKLPPRVYVSSACTVSGCGVSLYRGNANLEGLERDNEGERAEAVKAKARETVWMGTAQGVFVYDSATCEMIKYIDESSLPVSCLVESSGVVWAASSRPSVIYIWDAATYELVRKWDIDSGGFNALITAHGMVLGGATNGCIYIWDALTHSVLKVLDGHTDSVRSLSILGSHGKIISGPGSNDGHLYVWSLKK